MKPIPLVELRVQTLEPPPETLWGVFAYVLPHGEADFQPFLLPGEFDNKTDAKEHAENIAEGFSEGFHAVVKHGCGISKQQLRILKCVSKLIEALKREAEESKRHVTLGP